MQNLGHSGDIQVGSVHDPRTFLPDGIRHSLFARQPKASPDLAEQHELFSASGSQGMSPGASVPSG